MRKVPAILIVLLSIPLFTFGILFLIAAVNEPSRGLVGLALLAGGTVLLIAGLRWLRRLAEISPEALRTGAVTLARRLGGELTVSQFRSEYRIPRELATDVLEKMVAAGVARREEREERHVYVFTELLPSMAEKVCPYCGTDLPVRSVLRKCPNCGAQLEISKT
jgi:hypothetical protein